MGAIQDFQEAGDRGDKNPPYDADYFVSNLMDEYWPQGLSDKWGGVYALQEILPQMKEENGGTMEGLNLSIEAFNPKNDTRLHTYYVNRLRKAFSGDTKAGANINEPQDEKITSNLPSYKVSQQMKDIDKITRDTLNAVKNESKTHGRI